MTTMDRNAGGHGVHDSHGHGAGGVGGAGGGHHGSYLEGKGGIWPTVVDWASTVDHKKLGVMYLVAILVLFFLGGVAALALRTELLAPPRVQSVNGVEVISGTLFNPGHIDPNTKERIYSIADSNNVYNRLFTMHGAIMVFMVIVPGIPASLGNFFLPLMLGAKDVAFPRLNLLSWYVYLTGSLFGVLAILYHGVDTGWTFYTPYSTTTDAGHWRVVYMILAAFILGFSSILTGLNFVVTVHKLRAPGMGWWDMPLFVWAIYATAIIQVLATPVIGITLLLLVFERVFRVGIFDPALGGDPVLYQHFFWFYSHPVVYVMILPGMGVVSDVLAVHARKPIFGYRAIALASLGIAGVAFIVWGHHMFASMSEIGSIVFSALTFLVAIPTAVKIFNWIATLYKGSIALTTPMIYVLIFLFLFAIGGLTGLPLATLSTDLHLHDTYFVVAHFHYVMMGGTIIGLMAGLHHWWPKMFGRMYSQRWANVGALLVFIGFNLTFFTQFFLGTKGMPRRYAGYPDEFQFLHAVSTFGSYFLFAGFMTHLAVFLHSLAAGEKAKENPWGGMTLEWEAESPPDEHNFHHEPLMRHGPYDFDRAVPPHWDAKDWPLPDQAEVDRLRGAH